MSLTRRFLLTLAGVSTAALLTGPALADQASDAARTAKAAEMVDTAQFKKDGPLKVGVSAGYLANSWVVFALQHIHWEASKHSEIENVVVTDAGFNPAKQVSDIEDLMRQDIDLLIYWPVDDASVEDVLKRAVDAGIPTVQAGGGFTDSEGTVANAYISQYKLGEMVARQLMKDIDGKGKIVAMLPIAGTTAAVEQLEALEAVLEDYPDVELLSVEYGDWNRGKAKQITENLLQRFPTITGVYSPAGQMSLGMVEAFDEAGRLSEVTFSPGDEYNGWLKWVAEHQQGGAVTFPTRAGQVALQVGLDILDGTSVPRGTAVESEYIAPSDIEALVSPQAPDDWWASSLPEEFLPQQ
ncbi:substrate-binding domain-containing protein [Pseudohoeflea coraliihabitans]|uniref:Substrate-binding domain-containing protein n=1 Tax=Pseudohoeflea coraliihabitans TaxID=2860393 RepID=A0ABS6WSP4_9HYPH|nr:substrate-binding domain-containing protein [Pseudohoeflea sp. DP4N28-3]MBW3098987.1 substrate-binding domain-containing protein [Pseudohoeflea sp. DP4N28-3]